MTPRAPAGHGEPAVSAGAILPRVESDKVPGRSNPSVNGTRYRASESSLASVPASVSRQADKARDAAHADAKASRGASKATLSLSLDAKIRRVQEAWEASRASADGLSPGDAAPHDVYAETQHLKGLNRTSAANGHLGKRSSSGAFEVPERKRRAVDGGSQVDASRQNGPAKAIPNGSSEKASRRRSAPTTGEVNKVSADAPRDGPQVLRAVRSAHNKPVLPALRGATGKVAGPQVLEKTESGRHYKVFEDHDGKMIPTGGALIPDGYKRLDDETLPFVCPIRSCRKQFRNMTALGAHFGAGHRHVDLNDNGDGTLSVVGQFQAGPGPITARVVSRKSLGLGEPPMPTPRPPDHAEPVTATRSDSSEAATEGTTTAASRRAPRAGPPPDKSPSDRPSTPGGSSAPDSPAPAPTPSLGTKVMPYLRAVLPTDFNLGLFTLCKEGPLLLQLPVKRHITTKWIERATALKTRSQQCFLAILLFLTGTPAEDPCPTCVTSNSSDECIVPAASFPSFVVDRFQGSCAACFYRCNRWHQRNKCSLLKRCEPTAAESKAAFEYLFSGLEKDDMPSETDGESTEDQPPPAERSQLASEALENEVTPDGIPELADEAAENGAPQDGSPEVANSISAPHAQPELPSPQAPAPKPHTTSSTRDSQGALAPGTLLNQGNLMPADVLEMEDWEIAPGTIRNTSDEPDNIAFSNAYLFCNTAVPVAPGIAFNVITLKPGGVHKFPAQQSLRLCSLAAGKLSVKLEQESGGVGFQMGPNGMFKVYPGTAASVRNRLYVDAVLHVSTIESENV